MLKLYTVRVFNYEKQSLLFVFYWQWKIVLYVLNSQTQNVVFKVF
jgi:hypothetical protein